VMRDKTVHWQLHGKQLGVTEWARLARNSAGLPRVYQGFDAERRGRVFPRVAWEQGGRLFFG
jgi:hypothetical protein